jgi:hypothetical protein
MRLLGGQMSGQELKAAESELGALAKRYSTSALASERDLGDVFRDAQHSIRDALQRQNPQVADELRNINQSYAMFKRIQAASGRRAGAGKDEGVFTPMDLAAAVKSKDPTKDKAAFSRGDAIMQDFAEWGLFVMPQRVPDSGTTERAMWAMLGLGAGTVGVGPAAAMMAKGMVAATPYLGPVTRGLNRYAQPGAVRQGVRGGIETATPAVGAPAGVAAQRYDQSGNPVDASQGGGGNNHTFLEQLNPISSAHAMEDTRRIVPEGPGRGGSGGGGSRGKSITAEDAAYRVGVADARNKRGVLGTSEAAGSTILDKGSPEVQAAYRRGIEEGLSK